MVLLAKNSATAGVAKKRISEVVLELLVPKAEALVL